MTARNLTTLAQAAATTAAASKAAHDAMDAAGAHYRATQQAFDAARAAAYKAEQALLEAVRAGAAS